MSRTPFLAETAGFEPACPKGANAFRVRLVMTASIRLHVLLFVVRVFATCVARRGIYGIGAVFWSAVRVFATCVARRGIYGIGAVSWSAVRVFATCVAHRGIYGIGAVFWSAVRVFATCVAHSRASPYSDKLTEYCLHASMTQYPVSLSLHGSLPTRTLYHILGGLQGEVVG